jgi:hypothetical protein
MEITIGDKRFKIRTIEVKDNGESVVYNNDRIVQRFGDFDRAVRFEDRIVKALKIDKNINLEINPHSMFSPEGGLYTNYDVKMNGQTLISSMDKDSAHEKMNRIKKGLGLKCS